MSTGRASHESLGIIWLAFIAATFVYGVVLLVVAAAPDDPPGAVPGPMIAVFALLAVVQAGLSVWWRRRSLAAIQIRPPGLPATPMSAEAADRLATNCIVAWALAESIAIYGLVLGFLGRDASLYAPFGIAAVALLYSSRPSAWTDSWPRT